MNWFFLATCSAILSAGAAVIQKKVLFRISAIEFSFMVSVAILLISVFVVVSANDITISSLTLIILVGKSVLGGIAFLLVMMSLQHNQISTALPLLGITPALTALIAVPVLGESLQRWEWIGVGLMIAGTFMLEKRPSHVLARTWKEIVTSRNHRYIFGAVGLFALSSVFDKLLVSGLKTDPAVVLLYQHIVYCCLFGLVLVVRSISLRDVLKKSRDQVPLIVIIALLTVAYRFTQLEATKIGPVALVLAVKRTSILYASLFGGLLFSDERLVRKFAGAVLIVSSGFIILRNVT